MSCKRVRLIAHHLGGTQATAGNPRNKMSSSVCSVPANDQMASRRSRRYKRNRIPERGCVIPILLCLPAVQFEPELFRDADALRKRGETLPRRQLCSQVANSNGPCRPRLQSETGSTHLPGCNRECYQGSALLVVGLEPYYLVHCRFTDSSSRQQSTRSL